MDMICEVGRRAFLRELNFPEVKKKQKRHRHGQREIITTTYVVVFGDPAMADTLISFFPGIPDWVRDEWFEQSGTVRTAVTIEEAEIPTTRVEPETGRVRPEFNGTVHCSALRYDEDAQRKAALHQALNETHNTPKGAPRQKFSRRAGNDLNPSVCPPLRSASGEPNTRNRHYDQYRQRTPTHHWQTTRTYRPSTARAIPRVTTNLMSVEITTVR